MPRPMWPWHPCVWVSPRPIASDRAGCCRLGPGVDARGCCPALWRWSRCARMRLITAGSSMLAMTFIFPPQVSQVSISILNTSFRPCAHVMAAWRVDAGRPGSRLDAARVGPESLARAVEGEGRIRGDSGSLRAPRSSPPISGGRTGLMPAGRTGGLLSAGCALGAGLVHAARERPSVWRAHAGTVVRTVRHARVSP